MNTQTNELIGPALDWAVAKCEGHNVAVHSTGAVYLIEQPWKDQARIRWISVWAPSVAWVQGGPIIERAVVSLGTEEGGWRALCWGVDGPNRELYSMRGPTPLIAALRCYVASHLGGIVDVPDEFMA